MPLQFLAEQGYRITHLPVDEHGHISLADLKAALDRGDDSRINHDGEQ